MNFDEFVLCAATASLDDEPAAREHADAVEFRMDLAEDPIEALEAYDGELPILATNRADWEGGEATGHDRLSDLRDAAELDAVEAIDIELDSVRTEEGEQVAAAARDAGAAVVVSVHDFERTPSSADLRNVLSEATAVGDVGKLAVTARTPEDVLALLTATEEFDARGERVATMAMGEAGRHSRAVAPLYGSRIGYAPVDPDDATAPGQYDLATLRDLIDQLQSGE
ncbi:3-dehydroquinate dehydratase [Natronoarchaeum philippinense]|uniref:3-dehydroquinate dehydratase n=1 Tax=Natronoarchaeum philippinense TaxID=558529 RepID=A0A285NW74_NATPI|nr:type I 3-dehydroquinate dehydratase [Natronoarchaeum philippinense]SNZ13183.1 3-dehydroquinate dehydratase [Natronoarchaeum philippinense]